MRERPPTTVPAKETPGIKKEFLHPAAKEHVNNQSELHAAHLAETREVAEQIKKAHERIERYAADKESKAYHKHLQGDFSAGDFPKGGFVLPPEQLAALNLGIKTFKKIIKDSPTATSKGYPVAAAYDAKVQGWTTQSRIETLPDGKRVFVLVSYPNGKMRRRTDRFMEWLSGDSMRKPKPGQWKSMVESRSNIPTLQAAPSDTVVMPYIESINVYDLFAHQKDIKDFGPFVWAEKMSVEERLKLLPAMARELAHTHQQGKTWGEAILPNFILTKDQQPILIDAETTYENSVPVAEQMASDVRNMIVSTFGALARAEKMTDPKEVINQIIDGYGPTILEPLKQLCSKKLPWRQRLTFNLFQRFRLGATDYAEFERVRTAIVAAL